MLERVENELVPFLSFHVHRGTDLATDTLPHLVESEGTLLTSVFHGNLPVTEDEVSMVLPHAHDVAVHLAPAPGRQLCNTLYTAEERSLVQPACPNRT